MRRTGVRVVWTACVALTDATEWPRGRRYTRVVSQASGQAANAGIGRWASWKVSLVSRHGSAGVDTAIEAATSGSVAVATRVPAPPIECPRSATVVTSG